jgi:hypothetical protein
MAGLESAVASLAGAVGAAPMERALRHSCYRQEELEVLITLLPEIAGSSSRSICTKKRIELS